MTTMGRRVAEHKWACLGIGVFVASMAAVFFQALPEYAALASPDSGPYFPVTYRCGLLDRLFDGSTFAPQMLYWFVFPPLVAHELTYVIDTLMLTLAGVYYLTGRRVHPLAAWVGGLALGLSGYTFTLFCAGHRGYFHMFSCAVWAFGLLVRCFETRRLFYFAMLGLVFAWGAVYQPDVLVLVGALAAAYALWLTATGGEGVVRRVVSVWPRFLVSVAVLSLAGFGGLRAAVTTQMANRDAQIAAVSAQEQKTAGKTAAPTNAEKHERWIFATNWSLPPEDMAEFVVPGVFGNDSMQPPYPYWGRLGRPSDEVFQKGRMMPNYRQHTVYLGLIPVLLALLGVTAYFTNRRENKLLCLKSASGLRPPVSEYSDVPFWCAVWAVCLVLALGRYTPVYRLVYALPYMDYIRAPVKFHHLVEIATAFLAGFGMDAFLRPGQAEARRKLMALALGAAGVLLVGTLVAVVSKSQVVSHIAALGMGQVAAALGDYAVENAVRAVLFAALVAVVAFVSVKRSGAALAGAGCALLALLCLDQSAVARRYVRVIDVEALYAENPVVKAIKKAAGNAAANVINYATPNAFAQEWFSTSLAMNGINNLAPSAEERDAPLGKLFEALQKDPVRLWRIAHVQHVIVPRKACESLLRAGVLRDVMDFELGAGTVRQVSQPGDKTFTLARVADATAAPRFLMAWKAGVPADKQAEAAIGETVEVSDAPVPFGAAADGKSAAQVSVLSSKIRSGALSSRVRLSAKAPGLLVFDERLAGKQEILVDGRPAPLYVVDAVWPAALVPSGEHEVVLRQPRACAVPFLSVATALAVVCWGLFGGVLHRRPADGGAVA